MSYVKKSVESGIELRTAGLHPRQDRARRFLRGATNPAAPVSNAAPVPASPPFPSPQFIAIVLLEAEFASSIRMFDPDKLRSSRCLI